MEFERFELRIEGGCEDGRLKLVWTATGQEVSWPAQPYEVSRGSLQQASETVRGVLRRLATLPDPPPEDQYRDVLRELFARGGALCDNLFTAADGGQPIADEARELLRTARFEAATADADPPSLEIILCDETIHVPWGFALDQDASDPPVAFKFSVEDLADFWLVCFRLSLRFQGGRSRLPKPGCGGSRSLYALHEDLFTRARAALRKRNAELDHRLDELLGCDAFTATTWTDCQQQWRRIAEEYDSILYMFGHSDGERIVLADGRETVDAVLPASSFGTSFRKRGDTRSASICILNGCRTAAPSASQPWPASFLSATRKPGFFGFVGTETEVPNDFASRYGVKLLWRLCREGQSLGDAFDALRREPDLFPLSMLYTCFANRNFRLPVAEPQPAKSQTQPAHALFN